MEKAVKFKVGKYLVPVTLIYEGDRIFVKFGFNRRLIAEVKSMHGAKWHGYDEPPRKIWSVSNSPRNDFQIRYLMGENVYERYDQPIQHFEYDRPLYDHQKVAADFILTRHYCELAAGCGVGKTLVAIEVAERVNPELAWYVAPKSALYAVEREFKVWNCGINFEMMTYERLVGRIKGFGESDAVPQLIVVDEASRVKNATAQRSQATAIAADYVREAWGKEGYVLLMSGSPSPKSPMDWHHQTEVCCPGFLKEGTAAKLKQTLAIAEKQENPYGGHFYQIISWRDDSRKCDVCGEFKDHELHQGLSQFGAVTQSDSEVHDFKPSVNEVARLSKRLEGLVLVQMKEDCLDLPDKIYRQIELKPTQEMIQVAQTIVETAPTTISGLTLLRELSDGFQYEEVLDGFETCPVCKGDGRTKNPLYESAPDHEHPTTICDGCGGKGHRKKYRRESQEVECPKDGALRELLDEFGEVGRVVIYGGFQGSIDRIIKILEACKWDWIRADGRGWNSNIDGDHLENFQDNLINVPRLAFVGQPGAAGMGLTLTASPVIIYYSNDFNAESRIQSEERTHRPGMDLNRGCTIIDLLHLPPDYLVLDNLKKKRRLQSITLGQIKDAFDA